MARKGNGKEAKLSYNGNLLTENRNGLIVNTEVFQADGTAERDAALVMMEQKEREKLHEMTDHRQCFKPIPQLIEELNRHLEGWKNYFDFGYPRVAFGEINRYIR